MSNGLNWDTRQRIDALSSANKRLMGEKKALNERVAVLENLVQSVSDDRDGYMERCVELEDERDRARRFAVDLEQDGAMAHKALVVLASAVLAEVSHNTTVHSKALAVMRIAGRS